jgi:hypothetical protein
MNATELKKAKIKAALTYLEKVYSAEAEGGGGSNFYITLRTDEGQEFSGQFSRRDFTVALNDSVKLAGNGWSKEEIAFHKAAVEWEENINRELEAVLQLIS